MKVLNAAERFTYRCDCHLRSKTRLTEVSRGLSPSLTDGTTRASVCRRVWEQTRPWAQRHHGPHRRSLPRRTAVLSTGRF